MTPLTRCALCMLPCMHCACDQASTEQYLEEEVQEPGQEEPRGGGLGERQRTAGGAGQPGGGGSAGPSPALCTSPTGPTCLHIAQTCLNRPTCPTNDPYVWTSEEIEAETIPKDDTNIKSPKRPKN